MFRWKRERVPEGGAIENEDGMSTERYGQIMLERLGDEYRRFARFVVERGAPPRGARVLEVGPGPGWVSIFVAKERPDLAVSAVDASADMVRTCRANFHSAGMAGRADVALGTVERLGDSINGPFDLVYTRDSLHHWTDPREGFRNIRALLAPGGVLVVADERRDLGPLARLLVAALSRRMGAMGRYWRSSLAAGYTPGELDAILGEAGFQDRAVMGGFVDIKAVAYGR